MVAGEQQMTWTVSDVMAKDAAAIGQATELVAAAVVATTPSTSLADAASLMFQHRIPVLPVVDTRKQPVGIVSRTQVLKVFLRSDEAIRREVVGIFHDAASVTRHRVEVEVEVTGGLVRLHGEIEEELPKTLLKRIAGVPGVVGVKSGLVGELSVPRSGASANRVRA
jgi:CBS domain-containing protein